jgi:anti-anti-sigma factor
MDKDLQLDYRSFRDIRIVDISGRLDDRTTPKACSALDELIEGGYRTILLQCSKLDYINSEGLRLFLASQKKMRVNGGSLHLSCLQPQVMKILKIAGFDTIFRFYERENDALEWLSNRSSSQ